MISELRRSRRYNDFLPISVSAVSSTDRQPISGPFSGRIIDISRHGACLLMTQVLLRTYHIYHTTREDDSRVLQLKINIPPDLVNFIIPALPVWIKPFDIEEIKAFKMGVDFLLSPEGDQMQRLEQVMRKKQTERDELWASVTTPFLPKGDKR